MINESGEEFLPAKYSHIGKFKNGKAIVTQNGLNGIIYEKGNESIKVSK